MMGDAESDLYIAMKRYRTNLEAWDEITVALQGYIDEMGAGEDEIMELVGRLETDLDYTDDQIMDLDISILDWLNGDI